MKQVFLGMDIGGSKTDVILADQFGKSITKFKSPGINIHNMTSNQAVKNFENILIKLKSAPELKKAQQIESACIGMASFDSNQDKKNWQQIIKLSFQKQQLTYHQLQLVSDAYLSLKSGTHTTPAMCLIVGTGVSCYGLDSKGEEFKAGDWGYLAGDQGSGYWLGKKLLEISLKELDGRLPKSTISELIQIHTKTDNLSQLIDWIYHTSTVAKIAGLTQLLSNPVIIKQPAIQTLLHQAIEELIISVSAVYQRLEINSTIKLVCTGGMFANQEFKSLFTTQLQSVSPLLQPIFPQEKPVYTALSIATNQTKL